MSQTKAQVDKLLSNVSNGYFPKGYIAEKVLPPLPVKQKSGLIGAYGNDHIRIEDDLVGGEAEAKRAKPILRKTDNTYIVGSHALEGVVTQDDYDNVEEPFSAESDEVEGLTHLILTNKENALATAMTNDSVLTQNVTLSGTSQLSDYTNSDPLGVFKTAQNAILTGCGMMPNAAVMSRAVYNTLKYHPKILSTLGYAQNRAGLLTEDDIKKALDVQTLFIGEAAANTAKEGQADVLSQIWGKHITFFVRPDGAGKHQVSLGYYIKMQSRKERAVYKYSLNNPPESNGIIVKDDYSFHFVNVKAAYLVKNAIA